MKKYPTLLLSSGLLLASLVNWGTVQAQTTTTEVRNEPRQTTTVETSPETSLSTPSLTDPTKLHQPIQTQLNGRTLSVFYQRSAEQAGLPIRYAVWSDEQGKDDSKWYDAGQLQTDIDLAQHGTYGSYTIQAYITIDQQDILLGSSSFQRPKPQPTITANVSEKGFLDVRVDNVPESISEIKLPTWSENKGQDDLKWYTATKNADGSYGLRIALSNHKSDTGIYLIHLYGREGEQQPSTMLGHVKFHVEDGHLIKQTPPTLTAAINQPGFIDIRVDNVPESISEVKLPTWSDKNGQDDLKWHLATKQADGSYTVRIALSDHKADTGNYTIHLYGKGESDSKARFLGNTKIGVEDRHLQGIAKPKVTAQVVQPGFLDIRVDNLPDTITEVKLPTWSDKNGQDDLKWHIPSKNADGSYHLRIPLADHKSDTGNFNIHLYGRSETDSKARFLGNAKITVDKTHYDQPSSPDISTKLTKDGMLEVTVKNLPKTVTHVKLPTWSDNKGQDDLHWYTAKKNEDGTYGLKIALKDHHFDTGTYHIHLYTQEAGKEGFSGVGKTEVTVQKQDLPSQQEPSIQLESLNAQTGQYKIVVQESSAGKKIQSVVVATWSTDNQSNLLWREATAKDGRYSVHIQYSDHQGHNGHYQNHVYITYADGSRVGYIAKTVDLTQARQPIHLDTKATSAGVYQATLSNVYDKGTVRFAVWSDKDGQDDLVWYEASQTGERTYTATIPTSNHSGNGTYHIHAYQEQRGQNKGLHSATFKVNNLFYDASSYPTGECTWGVKSQLPWVGPYWGDAKHWVKSAQNAGFTVGTVPRVGAVAVWTGGYYGHVALVTAVQGTYSIQVSESNYMGRRYIGNHRGWFNPTTTSEGAVYYIYGR